MMYDWQGGAQVSLHGVSALLVMAAVLAVVYGIPSIRIVRRVGFPAPWGLLAAVPFVNIVALWVFAFRSWPLEDAR